MTSQPTTATRSHGARSEFEPIPVPAAYPATSYRIGELALLNHVATREQLQDVLSLQQKAREAGAAIPLGELFVLQGAFDTRTRDALLHVQRRQRELGHAPRAADTRRLTPRRAQELGRILQRNGMVASGRIDEALRIQASVRARGFEARLGEVLVRQGIVTDADVEHALQIQRSATHSEREETLRLRRAVAHEHLRHVDLLFGRVAVHHGFITEEQLAGAVEVQEMARDMGFHLRIGEILHDQEVLTATQIEQIATIQDIKKESFFEVSPHRVWYHKAGDDSVGDLLVRHGLLDPWQVQECARIQSGLGRLGIVRPLGEIVVMKGYVSTERLHEVIEEQMALRAQGERTRARGRRAVRWAAVAAFALLAVGAYCRRERASPSPGPCVAAVPGAANRPAPAARLVAGVARGAALPAPEVSVAPPDTDAQERREWAARAAVLFADLAPDEPALRLLAWDGDAGPRFETVGRAPVAAGTEVHLSLLYYGAPVENGAVQIRARDGLFRSLLRAPNCACAAPPGLYTAVAEWHVGPGDEPAQVRLAYSLHLGTEEEAEEFRIRAAAVRTNGLEELERWEADVRAAAAAAATSRSLENWLADLVGWRSDIEACARAADACRSAHLVSPFPEADRLAAAAVAQARLTLRAVNVAVAESFGRATGADLGDGAARVQFPLETLGTLRTLLRDARRALAADGGGPWIVRAAQAELERRVRTARRLRRERDQASAAGAPRTDRWEAEVAYAALPDAGLLEILHGRPPGAALERVCEALNLLSAVERSRIESENREADAAAPTGCAADRLRLEEAMRSAFAGLEGER